jgi:hypothetical protein
MGLAVYAAKRNGILKNSRNVAEADASAKLA